MDAERWLSLKEAATDFNISHSHLRLLARTGRLPARKLGRDWFTTAAAVAAYLADDELRKRTPHKYTPRC